MALANHGRRSSIESSVLGNLRDVWGRWRESRRQYQLERALYKMNGGRSIGPFGVSSSIDMERAIDAKLPRVEAPKGEAPDARAK